MSQLEKKEILTQVEIANRLDMSERNLRNVLKEVRLDHRVASFDEILIAYIRHLRDVAAGRGGEAAGDLTRERARLTKELANKATRENEEAEEVIRHVDVLTNVLAQLSKKIAGKLEAIPVRIKRETGDIPRDVMDIIESVIVDVRNEAYAIELDWEELDEMEEAAKSGENGAGAVECAGASSPFEMGS